MTNHWGDLANADRIMIIGSNAAENHPVSFKWVLRAIHGDAHQRKIGEAKAKLISVDPRLTRTGSRADLWVPIRPGTDIAFIGGMIRYAIEKGRIQKDYVIQHTNAGFKLSGEYTGAVDGIFTGFDPEKKKYNKASWSWLYKETWQNALGRKVFKSWVRPATVTAEGGQGAGAWTASWTDEAGAPAAPANPDLGWIFVGRSVDKDPELGPGTVYDALGKHFARYTPEKVSEITGTPMDKLLRCYELYTDTHKPEMSGTILYAMGTTQHTVGSQNIRSYGILQLLLGNMGVAGGGINALRGESNVQGSTDMGLLFHILPGYIETPVDAWQDLKAYNTAKAPFYGDKAKERDPNSLAWWSNYPKYIVSLLKAYWGDDAKADNDFRYAYLPKRKTDVNYSHMALFEAMEKGSIKGLMALGQNPAVGGPNALQEKKALANLDWLVAVDLWSTETATFWKRPGVDPSGIKTEVFFLPAAGFCEKEGSVTNSGRWAQWRTKAQEPPGMAKSDLWIVDQLARKLKEEFKKPGTKFPDPLLKLSWAYGEGEEPDVAVVSREINGSFTADGSITVKGEAVQVKKGGQVPTFANLQDNGMTACGCWVYAGSHIAPGVDKYAPDGNRMKRRSADRSNEHPEHPIGLWSNWAWVWPANRRIVYNMASVDSNTGKPWAPSKPVVWWDGKAFVGDVPDGNPTLPPGKRHYAFIMRKDGHGDLFSPDLVEGPLPEHYEPLESPVPNAMSKQQTNPCIKVWRPEEVGKSDAYPIVCTTYRVTEHWQAGAMTRSLPWLVELVPTSFVEIGEELAREKGIKTGEKVVLRSKRGSVEVPALVTKRMPTLLVGGKRVHQAGIVWHFGYEGLGVGATANDLTPTVGDANTMIPEYKAFLVDIVKTGGAA